MSILIKGMKMPKSGHIYSLVLRSDGVLIGSNSARIYGKAVELLPHGRLIDADALLEEHGLGTYCPECKRDERACQFEMIHTTMDFCEWIEDAPTIIEAERVDG